MAKPSVITQGVSRRSAPNTGGALPRKADPDSTAQRKGRAVCAITFASASATALPLLAGTAISLVSFAAYLLTMVPTVTWRNGGSDGAELATAAHVWGVAHPPGYPLYLTLARLFQLIPTGDVHFRTALLSAAAASLASVVTFMVTWKILTTTDGQGRGWRQAAGVAFAGSVFAFGPLAWSQATVAEVYSLGTLLYGLTLLAFLYWLSAPSPGRAALLCGVLALLLSHQPTFAVLLPLLGAVVWWKRVPASLWLPAAPLLALAPLLLATVWLRGLADPALNWGEPTTLDRWLHHVTAQDYRGYFMARPLVEELPRIPFAVALLVRQGGWLALALAVLGGLWLWSERRAFTLVTASVSAFFFVFAVFYNAQDSEVYLLPAIQVAAVAAGVGACWILHAARGALRYVVVATLALSVAWQVATGWVEVDLSDDFEARRWGEATLAEAQPGALIRTARDQHTFVLWYLQLVEGLRPDVIAIDERLLHFEWYRAQMESRFPGFGERLQVFLESP